MRAERARVTQLHVCSFHDASGSAIVAGRVVRWDFSVMFGPLFVSASGVPLKNQPSVTSREWAAFEAWLKARHA